MYKHGTASAALQISLGWRLFNNYINTAYIAVTDKSRLLSWLFSVNNSLLLGLFHDEGLVDVWNDTTAGNCGLDQCVELLVTSDCEQQVSWCDSLNLEILGGVTCELKHLGSQVLEDGGGVNC